MRIILAIVYRLLLLSLVSSCVHEPACERPPKNDNVELIPQWPDSTNKPSNVFVQCYPKSGETIIQNFIPSSGGFIYLPQGDYELLLYTNTSSLINFRYMETLESAEAYVDEGMQPDEFYCGDVVDVGIRKTNILSQIKVPMVNMVYKYLFRYSGVTGLQYVNRIFVSVDGINLAVNMGSGIPTSATSVVNCPYSLTTDGFHGALHCFGHGSENTKHSFTVRFDYGGQTIVKVYDVTEMLNKQGRIDIHDTIVFEPLGEGGVDTGVGDWEDDMVDIPVN